ncbi:MAG: hypothetical protein ACKKL4_01830 [Patescibacteria group bacterium]
MKKLLKVSSLLAIIIGSILVASALWGIVFTYTNVTREHITTTSDASIPSAPVRGPLTLKSQADIIRDHTLSITEGETFAQMPRQIPKLDAEGNSILDEEGNIVMEANTARDIWFKATALTTALQLAIFAYAFSLIVLVFGFYSIVIGIVFYTLAKRY